MRFYIFAISLGSLISLSAIAKSNPSGDVQLKLAKLWGKIDELEVKLKKQEERILVLEKGLMLGLIPEEIIKDRLKIIRKVPRDVVPKKESSIGSTPVSKYNKRIESSQKFSEIKSYRDLVRDAQESFGRGEYGQAISTYQQIEKHYPEKNDEGQSDYWIGLSWYFLKEYDLSLKSFTKMEIGSPGSPWIASVKFYKAKINLHRGLLKQAMKGFSKILEEYPDSDTSEMAAKEIEKIRDRI